MKLAIALLIASAHALVAPSRRQHQGTALRATAPLSQQTGFSSMDTAVLDRYMSLDTGDNVQAEYVFVDADRTARSKCRTLPKAKAKGAVTSLPKWTYDGSSTGQAPGDDSEVIIVPRAVYKDPFRGGDHILVLCDTEDPEGNPLPTNSRAPAVVKFDAGDAKKQQPWYGLEQEYTLFNLDGTTPLGWPVGGFPKPQGPYYCGAGADKSFGRAVSEAHYRACLYAGLTVSGTNAEVMPGQWEYQIGPVVGIDAADQLTISRYILDRVCEDLGVIVSIEPKPIEGDWNGAGMHINFSTEDTRKAGGLAAIEAMCEKLGTKHDVHIAAYASPAPRDSSVSSTAAASILESSSDASRRLGRGQVRRGQREAPHGRLRDRRHQHVLVRRRGPRLLRPHPARHGRRGLRLPRGPPPGVERRPVPRDRAPLRDVHVGLGSPPSEAVCEARARKARGLK